VTIFLKPFDLLWRGVNRVWRALYRRGILKSKRLPRPVISVGNLAAGRAGNASGVVTSLDAAKFGDEPVLMKSKLKNIDVIVGSKRYQNAVQFLSSNECDLFILDDGFQHLHLARDVDVVLDAGTGVMREGRSALADADFVIQRRLRLVVPEELIGRRIFAFAGLAGNEQFFASLRKNRLDVIATRSFRDHHRYTAADIAAIKEAARTAGAEAIVTTEKDAVKIDDRDIIARRGDDHRARNPRGDCRENQWIGG
jgi:tetraacyldisaccharide 4'-kinase